MAELKRQIATILVPLYQKANHYGATPVQYPHRKVVELERELLARCTMVQRGLVERVSPDTGPGGAHLYPIYRTYTVEYENPRVLGEIAGRALAIYEIEKVEIMRDPDTWRVEFDKEAAANVAEGFDD